MKKRIVIIDDHAMFREGLQSLLEARGSYDVIGQATDGRLGVRLVVSLVPDLVIMDISMPGLNGIEATRQIHAECPGVKILALSMHADRRFVDEMLCAGASGYVIKEAAFSEVEQAMEAVFSGRTWLSPTIMAGVTTEYIRLLSAERDTRTPDLTPREKEVLQLVAEGLTNREIGLKLFVSPKTVDTHRQQIMRKLGIGTVAELTKYAIREGITGEC